MGYRENVFAEALVTLVLEASLCPAAKKARSLTSRYQVMWTGYHHLSISSELSTLWNSTVAVSETRGPYIQHFIQLVTVTRRVMDESVKLAFPIPSSHGGDLHESQLKADEEQALHYTAGYVPMKLNS